jgi:purine-binding chemotaxis protein CheW
MAAGTQSVLVFACGEGWYAIPAGNAAEIVTFPALTPLPGARPHLLGVFAHRGEVIPVIDLGRLVGEPTAGAQRAVLVRMLRGAYGLATTRVSGVEEVEATAEPVGARGLASALREPVEVRGQMVTFVDVEGLFELLSEGR